MPTSRNYDENGRLTSSDEPATSFDSFLQGLDEDYDKRKESRKATVKKTPSQVQLVNIPQAPAPGPLTLEGPIAYRDQNKKKTTKKEQPPPPASAQNDSQDNDFEMVYDEDEAW